MMLLLHFPKELMGIIYGIIAIAVLITAFIIIGENRNIYKTYGYLLILFALPVVGMLLLWFFGLNGVIKKHFTSKRKLSKEEDNKIHHFIRSSVGDFIKKQHFQNSGFLELIKMNANVGLHTITENEVEIYENGENKYPKLFDDLRKAEKTIEIQYYIFENGTEADELAKILIEKVKSGVEVRILYDSFGSSSLQKKYIKNLKKNGIKISPFFKIKLLPTYFDRWNFRNHRKIVIIDRKIGYVGGINFSDKYNNHLKNKLYWRDTMLRIKGSAAYSIYISFCRDWFFATKEMLLIKNHEDTTDSNINNNALVQLSTSGPDRATHLISDSFCKAISSAKEEIKMVTPYFIPNDAVIESLRVASTSGCKVEIMVPEKGDSYMVSAAARTFYEPLMDAGVKFYNYRKGFIHSKKLLIDDELSIVGSANMDFRSLEINFEINANVYSHEINQKFKEIWQKDLQDSEWIDPHVFKSRPWYRKYIDSLCRLVSPLF